MARKPKETKELSPEMLALIEYLRHDGKSNYKTRLQIATEEGYPDDEFLKKHPEEAKARLNPQDELTYREFLRKRHKKRHSKWSIIDSDGSINYGRLFKRLGLYFLIFYYWGLVFGWMDRKERKQELEERIARSKNYYQYDPNRPANEVKAYPPGGGKVIYRDFSQPYDLTKDFYYNGLPGQKSKSTYSSGKSIRRWGNTTTIESGDIKIELEMSPEDILEHIDEEDILDYIDGAVD